MSWKKLQERVVHSNLVSDIHLNKCAIPEKRPAERKPSFSKRREKFYALFERQYSFLTDAEGATWYSFNDLLEFLKEKLSPNPSLEGRLERELIDSSIKIEGKDYLGRESTFWSLDKKGYLDNFF